MICKAYKTKPIRQTRYDPITGKPNSEIRTAGYCSGTRENDLCDCGGDTAKCDFYPEKRKPITNFDRIKAMSVEELAELIRLVSYHCSALASENGCCGCRQPYCERTDLIKWLESEVQSDA